MPRRNITPPRLCSHPNGQACIYVNGRVRYLGKIGTAKAEAAYRTFVIQWASGQLHVDDETIAPTRTECPTISVAMLQFWVWADQRYRHANGQSTRETENFRAALKPLRRLFGALPIDQFGPNRLRMVQEQMIRDGLSRQTINKRVGRIRQLFRWCVGREMCPPAIYEALRHVEPVKPGQGAHDAPRRKPVSWATVEATLPHLSPLMRAFALVLWHTGARVGEIRVLTTDMIDQTGDVWRADLAKHKTAHHGKERVILFGPQAQLVLKPWLRLGDAAKPIFSPRRADKRSAKRKGVKAPGRSYDRCGPGHAMRRACARAFPHPTLSGKRDLTEAQRDELKRWDKAHRWSLAQLRHAKATTLRERFGLDVAQVVLGHAKPTMTAHYSSTAIAHAVDAMREAG